MVKGLDYALLARRKAELAAQGEDIADEELEELARGVAKGKTTSSGKEEKEVVEEPMAKGVSLADCGSRLELISVQIYCGKERGCGCSQEEKEKEEGQSRT